MNVPNGTIFPVRGYRPTLFRLPGLGGAVVYLRSGVINDDGPELKLDIGLVSPTAWVWYPRKPMRPGLARDLGEFFYQCASELHPEVSVSDVQDDKSGLAVTVMASSDDQVELEFHLGDDGVNFITSRVVLAQAASEVLVLESVRGDDSAGAW